MNAPPPALSWIARPEAEREAAAAEVVASGRTLRELAGALESGQLSAAGVMAVLAEIRLGLLAATAAANRLGHAENQINGLRAQLQQQGRRWGE